MLVRTIRPLIRRYPLRLGRGWLANRLVRDDSIPQDEIVRTKVGVLVRTRPDYMFKHIYLYGEYEPENTNAFGRLIRPGDVCLDVGANFGYFSCYFASRGARVLAFEPVPTTFALAQDTIALNNCGTAVKLMNLGLGEAEGKFTVYTFSRLSHGHASSSDLGRGDAVRHE